MRQRDPAKAVEVLDLLLEFFADGALWLQRGFHDPEDGSRCLVSALNHVRRKHGITGDGTGFYLLEIMPQRAKHLIEFNDTCRDFGELRAGLTLARAMALLDWRRRRERERLAA
jgi:hypothetical protein